jgi:hypothetical protein
VYEPVKATSARATEITAIPELPYHLAEAKQFEGALATIDASCQAAIADKIVGRKADYLLAHKGNQQKRATRKFGAGWRGVTDGPIRCRRLQDPKDGIPASRGRQQV